MKIALLISNANPGSPSSIKGHIQRSERIISAVFDRFNVKNPYKLQAKHLKWFLSIHTKDMKESTQYDYYRTCRVIAAAIGKWPAWEPCLTGPWKKTGTGGRKAKLAHKARK